jgi:hypothetical protein
VGLSADTNNILLVADVLKRLILKIGVLFGIGLLSRPTPNIVIFCTSPYK